MPLRILKKDQDTNREKGLKKSKMLVGGQAKLDKNKNNKIDAEDFKILKAEKKGQPKKAALGMLALGAAGALGLKKVLGKKKSATAMPEKMPVGDLIEEKKKELSGKKMGGVMKAKEGKLVPLKKDKTRPINPFAKKALEKGKKIIGKGGRLGAAATILGLAGAGAAKLGQTIGRKIEEAKKKNKKMGGGMMKYTKGGGADTGRMGELRSKLGVAGDEFRRFKRSRPKLKAPDRKPMKPLKAMGGGMIGASQMPGYKTGTSVKARGCKLGRSKPTKMY